MIDQQSWLKAWYEGRWWLWLLLPVLLPLSWLFSALAASRRQTLSTQAKPLSVPVIVVGNIAIGGTGKTPLLISMVKHLQQKGYKPGVISRGYGAEAPHYPYSVTPQSPAEHGGDEPLLIAMETACPVVVDANRVQAAEHLISEFECDVILSDDGLQHYKLSRQFEICVVDGARGVGNGFCLPAGPLREPSSRLAQVDCVVVNGEVSDAIAQQATTEPFAMQLKPAYWGQVVEPLSQYDLQPLPWDDEAIIRSNAKTNTNELEAVTGIGNPERFFNTLSNFGLMFNTRVFPDHYQFCAEDLIYAENNVLLMTAKDAVKCKSFAKSNWWYLSVQAKLPQGFWQSLESFMENSNE
mgnify:CR=1 FL=1